MSYDKILHEAYGYHTESSNEIPKEPRPTPASLIRRGLRRNSSRSRTFLLALLEKSTSLSPDGLAKILDVSKSGLSKLLSGDKSLQLHQIGALTKLAKANKMGAELNKLIAGDSSPGLM